jgi:hypothetical protein
MSSSGSTSACGWQVSGSIASDDDDDDDDDAMRADGGAYSSDSTFVLVVIVWIRPSSKSTDYVRSTQLSVQVGDAVTIALHRWI